MNFFILEDFFNKKLLDISVIKKYGYFRLKESSTLTRIRIMKIQEKLLPAKYGKQTVIQATTKSGELLGLYFDAENRVIPNNGEWTIIKPTKKSKALLKDILDSFEGHGISAKFENGILTANI